MMIRLEYEGRVLKEVVAAQMTAEMLIGRGHQCAWRIPEDDRNVSSVHLVLYRESGNVWVREPEPPSKNGSFFHGRRIQKPLRLTAGDKVTFGACVLYVEGDKEAHEGKSVPEVVVMSGRSKGQVKPVLRPRITIGSDPASTVMLLDDLVSRSHAEITLKEDGSCWIRDLKSKNGTLVNGMALREEQERMLKDGDRIGVAHLELRFQDGTMQRSGRKVFLGFGVLLVTVLVALGIRWMIVQATPPVERFMNSAKTCAATGDFVAALEQLKRADGARDADEFSSVIADLRRQVQVWQATVFMWTGVTRNLQEKRWGEASRGLGMLDTKPAEAWGWGPKGGEYRGECVRAKALLDALLRVKAVNDASEWSPGAPEESSRQLQLALEAGGDAPPEYLKPLLAEARICLEQVGSTVQLACRMEAALNGLTNWPPTLKKAVSVLEEVRQGDVRQLRERADRIIGAVRGLDGGLDQLYRTTRLAKDANFGEALKAEMNLPSREVMLLDSRLAMAWNNLRYSHENLKRQAGEAEFLLGRLKKLENELRACGDLDQVWRLDGILQKVLNCDSLEVRYSVRRADRPLGEYDRYLGIEYFYDFLRGVGDHSAGSAQADESLPRPLVVITADFFAAAARFQAYVESGEGQWMNGGALQGEVVRARAMLVSRDRIVEEMLSEVSRSAGRRAVIAAGIACRLSPDRASLKMEGVNIEVWIASRIKKLTEEVRRLAGAYDAGQAQEQIALREKILNTGIPGDRDVKRMWCQKSLALSGG
jgi:pSer/pThr/pTyr-binding forkhead associated (FHA) protein